MLKKLLMAAALMLSSMSSAIYANGCGDCCGFDFGGLQPYVGFVGGIGVPSGHYRAIDRLDDNRHFGTLVGTQGLFGGVYGVQTYIQDDIFLAFQFNTLYNTTDRVVRSGTNTSGVVTEGVRLKNHFQWGADVRFGMNFCGATPYVLGGFESGNWKFSLDNDSGTSDRGVPAFSRLSHSRTLWGGRVGAGVTFPLTCNFSANLEYSYTWFGNQEKNLLDIATSHEWNHRVDIRQNSFLFGLNYLF